MNPFVLEGLMCGDGFRQACKNFLTITTKDHDYYDHKDVKGFLKDKIDETHVRIHQNYPSEILTYKAHRVFPANISIETKRNQKAFLRGLYSANGCNATSVIKLTQTSYSIIEGVSSILMQLGYDFKIVSIQSYKNKFKTSYKNGYTRHST